MAILSHKTPLSKSTDSAASQPIDPARALFTAQLPDADFDALHDVALTAVMVRGWSVVPIRGDLAPDIQHAKAPAVEWAPYRQQLPTPAELREWFSERGLPGLAVVCGSLSQLVILDCDQPGELQPLLEACPFLKDTYTVLSANKRLPHFYLQPPPGVDLRKRGQAGKLELLGEGQVAVTAPTTIQGKAYTLQRGGDVLKLTTDQWARLLAHLEARTGNGYPDRQTLPASTDAGPVAPGSQQQLVNTYYRQVTSQGSRNAGLFTTACMARDTGWQPGGVVSALLGAHIQHPPLGPHALETDQQREREALTTIASAFSRPARRRAWASLDAPGLPTAVREHLLQSKNGSLARLLDALLTGGVTGGDIISQADIVRLGVAAGMGHVTIKRLLKDTTALRLVSLPDVPSGGAGPLSFSLITVRELATSTGDEKDISQPGQAPETNLVSFCPSNKNGSTTYCICKVDISILNSRGRKSALYQVPTIAELCAQFGVTDTRSDPLPLDALGSIAAYRQAVTNALIKRRPGQYSQHWLGQRVGVSARTIRRRLRDSSEIKVTPQVAMKPIALANLNDIPDMLEPADKWGRWLQDETGKKYRPDRQLAERLLKQGRAVWYCTQQRNHYQHADNAPRLAESDATQRQNNGKTAADAPQPGPQAPAPTAPPETPETAEFAPAATIRADNPDAWADRPAFAELTRPTIFSEVRA